MKIFELARLAIDACETEKVDCMLDDKCPTHDLSFSSGVSEERRGRSNHGLTWESK